MRGPNIDFLSQVIYHPFMNVLRRLLFCFSVLAVALSSTTSWAGHTVTLTLVKTGPSGARQAVSGKQVTLGGYHETRDETVDDAFLKKSSAQGRATWAFRDDENWRTSGWCVKVDGPYYCVDLIEDTVPQPKLRAYFKDARNEGSTESGQSLPLDCQFRRTFMDWAEENWDATCAERSP